jgi:predicted O-methyltransferase YrrM
MSHPWRPIGDRGMRTSVSPAEITALCGLAYRGDVLEVGTAWGYAAVMMAQKGAHHVTTVDPHQPHDSNEQAVGTCGDALRLMQYYGVADRITVVQERADELLPRLRGNIYAPGAKFDLVFVDGDHSAQATMHDLLWGMWLVRDGGFVACHDYGPGGIAGVTEAFNEVFPDGPSIRVDTLGVVQVWPHAG